MRLNKVNRLNTRGLFKRRPGSAEALMTSLTEVANLGIFTKRTASVAAPPLAPWGGDSPRLPAVRSALARRDVAGAVEAIRVAPLGERFELVWESADEVPYEWLVSQPATFEDDALLATYAGAAAMRNGWRTRGNADASLVATSQFKSFWAWLAEAEEHLARATALQPNDVTPWVYLLVTSRGLQRDRSEFEQVFHQALARDPQHLEVHRQMLQFLCKKWFGSHEEMFDFARFVSASAPAGSPLHELPILAHVERWVEFSVQDSNEIKLRSEYLHSSAVRADLMAATSRLEPLLAGFPDGRSVTARNQLAFLAWRAADRGAFVQAINRMHGVVSPAPWNYYPQYGSPVQAVARAWRELHK
jgi:hypothetical protein